MNDQNPVEVIFRNDDFRKGCFFPPACAHYRAVDNPEQIFEGEVFLEVKECLDKPDQFNAYFVAAKVN